MTATTLPLAAPRRLDLTLLHRAGAGLPPVLHTAGALLVLLLAVAATGLALLVFALVMPFALVAAALTRRRRVAGPARHGWRPAPA